MEKVYDYIVVGSGFGGSVASLRQSENSKRYEPWGFPKNQLESSKISLVACRENAMGKIPEKKDI